MSGGCHANKNSIFAVTITTNKTKQICGPTLCVYFVMINNP